MDIVVDTNIFLAVVLNEPEKDRIITLTSKASVLAPELLPYELGNAISALVKKKRISDDEAIRVLNVVRQIPVRLVSVDIAQALELALAHRIYAYDAYFLLCAKQFGCPLLTLDNRMKLIASELHITILE